MAILNLTIHGVSISKDANKKLEENLVLTTEERADSENEDHLLPKEVQLTNSNKKVGNYKLTLANLHFTKKMYQPTEILAEIAVRKLNPESTWYPVLREVVEPLFFGKKVSLKDREGLATADDTPVHKIIGEDYYVNDVQVRYKVNYMRIYLQINSLDKMLTKDNNCRTFVGKKLKADILKSEFPSENSKFVAPYDSNKPLTFDADSMKNLSYQMSDGTQTEHIFPYLVQYNESFYDMLARTTNRWGEFMYYEDGKLNIGCPTSEVITIPTSSKEKTAACTVPLFESLSYYNVDDQEEGGAQYDCAAGYDDNMLKAPIRIDPAKISGNLFCWGGEVDKVVMKKFSNFFKNEKNIPTFLTNEVFDELIDLASQGINVSHTNSKREDDYFTESKRNAAKEQYAECEFGDDKAMGYNPFSEINPHYGKAEYFKILKNEISAGKNAICINFDTHYPCLKLGQVISVYGKEYIVTQVDCTTDHPLKLKNDLWVFTTDKVVYSFQVYAIPKINIGTEENKNEKFFPTVIPSGHVRLADPQMAVVTDSNDPNDDGRVRVVFTWQLNEEGKVTDAAKKGATPWIQYTANAGGQKGIMGKHYKDDKVFVGFVDGNVERPYVIGAISKGAGADVHCATPGGHVFKLKDDKEGILKFLTSMFWPGWGTLSTFIPQMNEIDTSGVANSTALGGGFELTDKYGLYKISGSSDSRNISIASPWGDVKINAFTGISISAPNGDISIKGKNVSIEAGNNLSLTSGTNVKYKMLGDGGASGFFEDMGIAVAKKLTDMALSLVTVDLSMVRAAFEVVFRPVEGKLLVKSNRYLMLESGNGECCYPTTAYKNDETVQKLIKKQADKDVRPGLQLSSAVAEMIAKVNSLGNDISRDYLVKYNNCVEMQKAFSDYIKDETVVQWSDNYDAKNNQHPDVCKDYSQLLAKFWADDDSDISEEDLQFDGGYKATGPNDIADYYKIVKVYNKVMSNNRLDSPATKKKDIIDIRNARRNEILRKAKELRSAIKEFLKVKNLSEDKIKSHLVFDSIVVPSAFKKAFATAFKQDNIIDSFFFKALTEEQKELKNKYEGADPFAEERQFLKRKAAIIMLEEMGFKDDWRSGVTDANWVNSNPLIPALSGPRQVTVPRYDQKADLIDQTKWKNYVDSIEAVPKMSADQWKITKELSKSVTKFKENYTKVFSAKSENESWGEAKKGAILFSSDANVYHLKGGDISLVPSMLKEYLTKDDDSASNSDVKLALWEIRDAMKELK